MPNWPEGSGIAAQNWSVYKAGAGAPGARVAGARQDER